MESFLPKNFEKERVLLGIIAGRGEYPVLLSERVVAQGVRCKLIALEGETVPELFEKFSEKDRIKVHVGQLGKALKILKNSKVTDVILAGQVKPIRLFHDLHPDWRALCLLRKIKERNADSIFSTVCDQIERVGVRVLDARSFMEADVVVRSEKFPLKRYVVEHGIYISSEIARLDIGQGVIVKNGTVLCVEGFDGTDAMIRHVRTFGLDGMLFVKTSKPRHDFRFDVPVFGIQTLELMREAGIQFAALEAERTIILNQSLVLQRARQLGIKIFGY
ncbi:MAG: UDP-2,3-diacylglucosamine diphosphatase LpxI [Puniceicoccales bacterium]|nr:UDP-2,3-diacylglucosamine diphosphatase LpxI [Puniceicoccales bacterium]